MEAQILSKISLSLNQLIFIWYEAIRGRERERPLIQFIITLEMRVGIKVKILWQIKYFTSIHSLIDFAKYQRPSKNYWISLFMSQLNQNSVQFFHLFCNYWSFIRYLWIWVGMHSICAHIVFNVREKLYKELFNTSVFLWIMSSL